MINISNVVLITGATGAIGPRVVHALHQAGFQIRTFSADLPDKGAFSESVEVLTGDIIDIAAVQSAMEGVEAVIHLEGWGSAIDSGHGFSCYTLGRLAV